MKRKWKILMGCIVICSLTVLTVPRVHGMERSSAAGVITTQSTGLNVRETASNTGRRLAVLPKGSYVTLLERQGDWWYVEYAKGKYGYCSADYITQSSGIVSGTVYTQQTGLNVRKGPSTQYGISGVLAKGTDFVILEQIGNWCKILYSGNKIGYVSSTYVKKYGTPYVQITLPVPSYKQTDSRWSWYPLGTEGGTIRTIGCVVTGVSMMESYRKDTIITPNIMASKLTFTSGGALYWPSDYQLDYATTKANCLEKIYGILQSGRPVLVGGKTYGGSYHWIVVTGYTGYGSVLAEKDFMINDPGSARRTTLEDFFENCSVVNRLAYYKL